MENTKTVIYVWFLENTKDRKKMQNKMIFFIVWLSYEKYQRKSNIIKTS